MAKDAITGRVPQEQGIAISHQAMGWRGVMARVKSKTRAIRNNANNDPAIRNSVSSNRLMDNPQPSRVRHKRLPNNNTCPRLHVIKPCRNPHCFRPSLLCAGGANAGSKVLKI